MPRILLTYPPSARAVWYGNEALAQLSTLGDVVLRESEEDLSQEQLLRLAENCNIIISDKPTAGTDTLFRRNSGLIAFLRCAMDIRNIDVEAASKHGVLVTRAGPGFVHAVSELIIAQMINLARGLPGYFATYQGGTTPPQHTGRQLAGSTAGIVGFGNIGAAVAPVLKALGVRVVAYDPYLDAPPPDVEPTSLDTLLEQSDYVICLARHSPETENMANAAFFGKMKKGAFFINDSRGGLVDEEALAEALASGQLAGAAIDVGRGHDDHPTATLAMRPDVIASPHIGGMVPEAIAYQALQTVRQVRTILSGQLPEGTVNPDSARRLKQLRS
ncbi:Hydroxypyruvate reductase [compost metagenome]